jgi:hypothetical protein
MQVESACLFDARWSLQPQQKEQQQQLKNNKKNSENHEELFTATLSTWKSHTCTVNDTPIAT